MVVISICLLTLGIILKLRGDIEFEEGNEDYSSKLSIGALISLLLAIVCVILI